MSRGMSSVNGITYMSGRPHVQKVYKPQNVFPRQNIRSFVYGKLYNVMQTARYKIYNA
jgi:hypothetical protein